MDLLAPLDWGRRAVVNAGEGLGGLLGGDFTRQNLAKTLPAIAGVGAGLLTGGTMAPLAGAAVAALTQGGGEYFRPETMKAKSTGDLLTALGGDPDSTWQNIGMSVATDPFTYAGIGSLGAFGRGAKAASRIAPEALSAAGAGESALGAGSAGRSGLIASLGGDAAQPTSRLAEMLGARRDITKLAFNPETGEAALGAGKHMAGKDIGAFEKLLGEAYSPGWRGQAGSDLANPLFAVNANQAAAPLRATTRHELYHSMINRALNWGETDALSPMQKLAYGLYSRGGTGETGAMKALGLLADETGAHAAQEGAGALRQAMGGADFLFGLPGSKVNRAVYSAQLHGLSPTVGGLYDALGVAPKAALGGAAAAGGALGLRQLFQE